MPVAAVAAHFGRAAGPPTKGAGGAASSRRRRCRSTRNNTGENSSATAAAIVIVVVIIRVSVETLPSAATAGTTVRCGRPGCGSSRSGGRLGKSFSRGGSPRSEQQLRVEDATLLGGDVRPSPPIAADALYFSCAYVSSPQQVCTPLLAHSRLLAAAVVSTMHR